MRITELELTNFRAYETAKFTFKPGINLIAGVNGAGKSTALDALRMLLSRALRHRYGQVQSIEETHVSDIRWATDACDLSVRFSSLEGKAYEYLGHLSRLEVVESLEGYVRTASETTMVWRKRMRRLGQDTDRSAIIERPDAFRFVGGEPGKTADLGFALFFSPQRSLLTLEVSSASANRSPHSQALGNRRMNHRQIAEWWLAQKDLVNEGEKFIRRAEALEQAILDFLPPSIKNIRPVPSEGDKPARLLAVKDGKDLDLFELSDGERGILALVLETTRRLALAYPESYNPAKDGAACVLIDEIELHLHPQWQRDVLGWLTRTFPQCQFIATTHSPEIIGEVEPDRVHMIGKEPLDQTLGMDVAWILRHVMDTPERSRRSLAEMRLVEEAINAKNPEAALILVEEIERKIGNFEKLQALRTKAELMLRLRR